MLNKFLFLALATFWGGSFVAIKYVIHEIPSFTAAFYRVFFATIFLSIIYSPSLKLPKGFFGKELLFSLVAGLCSIGIPFGFLFWGEQHVSAGLTGVLNGTVPFWTLIVAITFFSQINNITKKKLWGLFAGFSGITLIFGPRVQISGDIQELTGLVSIILMAVFYAIGINLNRTILTKNKIISTPLSLISQHSIASIFLGILAFSFDGYPDFTLLLNPKAALGLFYLSFISTTLAFIIFFKLIKEMGPIEASTVNFFIPAVALSIDTIAFGHSLTLLEGVGAVIIFISMYLLKERKPIT